MLTIATWIASVPLAWIGLTLGFARGHQGYWNAPRINPLNDKRALPAIIDTYLERHRLTQRAS
jgi:hypothetical protein